MEPSVAAESSATILPPPTATAPTAEDAQVLSDLSQSSTVAPTATAIFTETPPAEPLSAEASPATRVPAPLPPEPTEVPGEYETLAPITTTELFETAEQPAVADSEPQGATDLSTHPGDVGGPPAQAMSWFDPEPETKEEPHGPVRRLWSRSWVKGAALCLVVAVAVVLIVGGIRFATKNDTGSGDVTSTGSSSQNHGHTAGQLSAGQLSQFQEDAAAFQNANREASIGFTEAGSTPTVAQVALPVFAYGKAVNDYNLQLNSIHWPASMQTAIGADHTQLVSLASLLRSFSSVSSTAIPAWISELHSRAKTTEAADNKVREDLGLPSSSSFP
jgi:hypothetical protein